jgi:hypothetical protein
MALKASTAARLLVYEPLDIDAAAYHPHSQGVALAWI